MEKNKNTETHCPSCGKFTGTYERCPYCGAEVEKRISIKAFRYGSVILAIVGVLLLWVAAINKEIPELDLTDIKPTMNFAFIKITGEVQNVRVYDNDGSITGFTFYIAKDDQNVSVSAYNTVAKEVVEKDLLPKNGSLVEIKGSLRIKDEGKTLGVYLQSSEHIKTLKERELVEKDFWKISKNDAGSFFKVKGFIVGISEGKGKAPGMISFEGKDGRLGRITVFNSVLDGIKVVSKDNFKKGAEFEASVAANVYKGNVQLLLNNSTDFKVTGNFNEEIGMAEKVDSELKKSDVNRIVSIEGKVKKIFDISPKIRKLNIDYNYGNIDLILFENVLKDVNFNVEEGMFIQAEGKVNDYKGSIQIVIEDASTLLKKSGEVVKQKKVEISEVSSDYEITRDDVGNIVKLTGTVSKGINLSGNMKYRLQYNNDNHIALFIPRNVIKYKKELESLKDGTQVELNGKVAVYKDELEIVMNHSKNIQIIGE